MSNDETLEANKLIADFMGVKIGKELYSWRIGCTEPLQEKHLNYHENWGWLMPVVDKIVEIDITPAPNWSGFRVEIVPRGYVKISGFPMTPSINTNVSIEGSLIKAVWLAVVRFVQWYNVEMRNCQPGDEVKCGVGKNNI